MTDPLPQGDRIMRRGLWVLAGFVVGIVVLAVYGLWKLVEWI